MREIKTHVVEGDTAKQVTILAIDEPGAGGANHRYALSLTNLDETVIQFQEGPIKEVGINGLTQEVLLAVVVDRLEAFQAGPFACNENARALTHTYEALKLLQQRTVRRISQGTEGTNAEVGTTSVAEAIVLGEVVATTLEAIDTQTQNVTLEPGGGLLPVGGEMGGAGASGDFDGDEETDKPLRDDSDSSSSSSSDSSESTPSGSSE